MAPVVPSTFRRTRRAAGIAAFLAALVAASALGALLPAPSGAAEGDVGVEGPAYVAATNPTYARAQRKVWTHDGHTFAALLETQPTGPGDDPDADHVVHRLDGATWVPTDTTLDTRATAKVDVVSVGDVLYVVSHKYVSTATGVAVTQAGDTTRINRLTYTPATGTYVADAGFPRTVNSFRAESLTLAVDATGTLWVTWVRASRVHWQRSLDGGLTWSIPTDLTDPHATTSADDIAAVVAFGDRVGILWSDQDPAHDGFWFTTTDAGSDPGPVGWTAAEAADVGPGVADDHVSLQALDGHVYAAVKTRSDTGANPLVSVLHRTPEGTWTNHTAYAGSTNVTGPVLQLDATRLTAELFVTGPEVAGQHGELGGFIYRKSAPLDALSFAAGLGQPVMARAGAHLNDATGAAAPRTAATGLTVVAADAATGRYWHHHESPPPPAAHLPFTSPEAFADQQARDFLGRPATDAERAAARAALVGGGATGADLVLGPSALAHPSVAGLDDGQEARVARLYLAYFRRLPDRSGFDHWVGVLRSGRSLERISQQFALSPEFVRTYGALTDDGFVTLVYANLFDRAADTGGRTYWRGRLAAGLPRGTMMTQLGESSEHRRLARPRVTVALLYRHLLQRMPTPAEVTAELAKPSLDVVVADLLASPAYAARITP